MRFHRYMCVSLCALFVSACMISEQSGQGNEDLLFHFDTGFNLMLLLGRSLALAVVALWIYTAWGKKTGATVAALIVLAGAAWLFLQDYPSLKSYEVRVWQDGLELNIPPEGQKQIPWASIEGLQLEGFEYTAVPMAASTPFRAGTQLELPEWETMEITETGGQKHTVNLKRLSLEQRQILAQAIVKRAALVKEY